MTILISAGLILGSIAALVLGIGCMIAANERIPGVNEPGRMDKREVR